MASGQRVAIKYLAPRLFRDLQFLAGFRAEAELLKSLDVPQVVRLYDYVEAPGQGAAIIMELVNGVSLHQLIKRNGGATPETALAVLKGSLLGLAAAHALGIVHRDYKPDNVLVDAEGNSKLTDFGVAIREGRNSPAAGTPLYMAPEQWNGTPATPATDIYAATAVFFECLTGRPPFTGRPGQLRQQHIASIVPVELAHEPLRMLIARGMAKDPAARPATALDLVAELESTAAAAYGPDWEARGRGHLLARAAALLLVLFKAPAIVGTAGTSSTSTWLPAAKAVAAAAKGTGLSGMQMAIAGTVLTVAVAAAATGGLVAAKYHNDAIARSAARPTPSAASAAPSPAAVPSSPACGSGPPPLAYEAVTGSGASATASIVVRCGTGTPHTVGPASNGGVRTSLVWSADGSQLAWLTDKTLEVAQAKAGSWALRSWSCLYCNGVAFQGGHAVMAAPQSTGTGSLTRARTQLLVFPESGSGQPTTLTVTGLPTDPLLFTRFWLLGSASPADVVVDYGDMGGSNAGGSQLLFRVNSAGQATEYGHATIGQYPPAPNTIAGAVGQLMVNQAGSEIAFTTYSQAGAACPFTTAYVLDPATGTITSPKVPVGGGPDGWLVQGVWFDQSGVPYISLVPNLGTCSEATPPSGSPPSPYPAGVTPIVCKLSGSSWVPTGRGVFVAAYGPGGWLAEKTGVTPHGDSGPVTLTISGGTGIAPVTVANVTTTGFGSAQAFAWAPYAAPPGGTATPATSAAGTPSASAS
jgi:serine/threonine-protein kinase